MNRRNQAITLLGLLAAVAGVFLGVNVSHSRVVPPRPEAEPPAAAVISPHQLFADRILPIFNSPRPSSCVQCHLADIDLKNYILPSSEKTFRSLRDQGLIDLDRPADSKILKLIQRGHDDNNRSAALIHEQVRQAEYQAFAGWIQACCADTRLRQSPPLTEEEAVADQVEFQAEVEAVAQVDKLLATFVQTVWARRNACSGCHMPGGKNNAKLVAKFGPRVSWMGTQPAATVKYLASSKLLDAKEPENSLLLLKGTAPVVGKPGELTHGGGKKMMKGDDCYKDFLAFAQAFAASRQVATDAAPPKTDRPVPKTDRAPVTDRRFIELQVEGLRTIEDNFKLRAALSQVRGVQAVLIDRRANGPSVVRVAYGDQAPDTAALLAAVSKSGFQGSKGGQ